MLSLVFAASYPAIAIAVLIGAAGAPLPLNVALAAAGGLARQGRLDITLLLLVCAVAAVAGDCLGYALGRCGVRKLPLPQRAVAWLARSRATALTNAPLPLQMGALVFFTRWAFTAPGPIVNLLAGARRYPSRSFLMFDATGEIVWCAIALLPGYLLGASGASGLPLALVTGLILGLGGSWILPRVLHRRGIESGPA